MPDIMINQRNITSGTTVLPFGEAQANWKFRRCPYARGLYTVLMRSDGAAAGMDARISIGTTEVLQRSPVSVGGTDGVMPTPAGATACPAHQFFAEAGDEVILELIETGAVSTTDVSIWANVEPA
jgi:hypothetical protein